MFSKILSLAALVAVSQAGFLGQQYHAPAYSPAEAVSSQSIVRHDEPAPAKYAVPLTKYAAAPAAHYATAPTVHYPVTHYTAAPVPHYASAPVVKYISPVAETIEHYEDSRPQYEYSYSVADGHSGDNKSQRESRDGDVVKGEYSFVEADGSVRKVEYTADDHNGFNAVVHNTAPTQAPAYVKAAPVHAASAYASSAPQHVKVAPVYFEPAQYHH